MCQTVTSPTVLKLYLNMAITMFNNNQCVSIMYKAAITGVIQSYDGHLSTSGLLRHIDSLCVQSSTSVAIVQYLNSK